MNWTSKGRRHKHLSLYTYLQDTNNREDVTIKSSNYRYSNTNNQMGSGCEIENENF